MSNANSFLPFQSIVIDWALSEATSPRRQKYLSPDIDRTALFEITRSHVEMLSAARLAPIIKWFTSSRSDLLGSLSDSSIYWTRRNFTYEELSISRIMNWQPFTSIAKSRRFIDLVRAFDRGVMPPKHEEFADNLRYVTKYFDSSKMVGRLILVQTDAASPPILVDGFTLASAYCLRKLHGQSVPPWLPAYVGLSDILARWEYA